jgi:hypothetical protein
MGRPRPNLQPMPVKHKHHRRCRSCGDVVKTEGATQPGTKLRGRYPLLLRAYVEQDMKATLLEIANSEGVSLSSITRRALLEWLAQRVR